MRTMLSITAILVALASTAAAQQADQPPPQHHRPTPEQRAAMMRKIHTAFVVELGSLLDLDTASTLKLGDRLQQFDDQRIQLRLENAQTMGQLRTASENETPLPNAAALMRKLMQNRVQLAQIDQAEAEEVMKSVPPAKMPKVSVFLAEYAKRVERRAHEIHQEEWNKHNAPPPSGE